MKFCSAIAASAAIQLAGCQPASNDSTDIAVIEAQLVEIEEIYSPAYDAAEPVLEAYLEYFADDAVLLHPSGNVYDGKPAARAFYEAAFADLTILSLDYYSPHILIDGDLAVRRYEGTAEFSAGDDPTIHAITNRYVDVLQKQESREWLIRWHQWTPVKK